MRLRAAAVAGLLALGPGGDDPLVRPAEADRLLVLYVGAEDCAPCRTWRSGSKPRLLRRLEGRGTYREVITPKLRQAFDEDLWPPDLRMHRANAAAIKGVPLWLVIRDDQVVAAAGGVSQWAERVLPIVETWRPSRRTF
jgi:hypothetical protein